MEVVPDSRGEWCDADTCADEENSLVAQEVLTSTAERPVDHDPRKYPVQTWGYDLAARILAVFLAALLLFKVAANSPGKRASEVTNNTNVDRNVIFLWCAEKLYLY